MVAHNADDIASETIAILLGNPEYQPKDETELTKIAYGIAKHLAFGRKADRHETLLGPAHDHTASSSVGARDKILAVKEILSRLDRTCRLILMMKWEGFSAREIRAKTSLPSENAVNVRYFRCFAEFTRLWEAHPKRKIL